MKIGWKPSFISIRILMSMYNVMSTKYPVNHSRTIIAFTVIMAINRLYWITIWFTARVRKPRTRKFFMWYFILGHSLLSLPFIIIIIIYSVSEFCPSVVTTALHLSLSDDTLTTSASVIPVHLFISWNQVIGGHSWNCLPSTSPSRMSLLKLPSQICPK